MIQSFHDLVDDAVGIFLAFAGQMQIDHGGFQLAVTEIALDGPDVDAGFQKMGGIGIAQGV